MRPEVPVLRAVNADVPVGLLFGMDAEPQGSVHDHHHHGHPFWTQSFELSGRFERRKLAEILDDLPETVIRAKGVFWCADEPAGPLIYQRVGDFGQLQPGRARSSPENNRLVLIGQDPEPDRDQLARRLEAAVEQ